MNTTDIVLNRGYETIRLERLEDGIARIVLSRPDVRNAQSPEMLYELDDAFSHAARDSNVKVILLAADGPDFSSGHDLKAGFCLPGQPVATIQAGLDAPDAAGHYAFECEAYLGLCKRWRDIPKPTIAVAQGRTIAGGLMLLWPMDIILAADDATFSDPVTAFGVNGIEYFTHAWELGARKAKEFLFTGAPLSAIEAEQVGMVNRVYPRTELDEAAVSLGRRIATRPAFGLRLAKESVNRSLDAQGQQVALDSALGLHNLGHAHNFKQFDTLIDPSGVEVIRGESRA
ncbi:enoyl-CoA hydratase [Rhodococcus erythropolis]|uniref:enoyl-CoA hydratase n=1 Tax=Rhodococcus erythropolis TaxID=1833 RepID=UPI001F3A30ED|nr:enoyl-CoA hydratase [Rhodococcus erythropolis]